MKILKILIILLSMAFSNGFTQGIQNKCITVYGKVKVFAKADRTKVVFTIKGVGSNLKLAFDEAKIKMQNISSRLHEIGLSEKNISTSFFQSSENFGDKAFLSSKKDYRAIMTVTVVTDSLQLLEPIIIIISKGEVEKIINVSFELTNFFKLKKQGLEKAILKAKEKAETVAKQLGISYGNVIEIEEIQSPVPEKESISYFKYRSITPFNVPLYSISDYENNNSIYSQEISFYSEVKVVFELLNSDM